MQSRALIYLLPFLFALATFPSLAQKTFSVSGYVKDAATGETLVGASVFDKATMKGTATNVFG